LNINVNWSIEYSEKVGLSAMHPPRGQYVSVVRIIHGGEVNDYFHGNSLIRDEAHRTVADQWALTRDTCHHVAHIIEAGHNVVVTHGNGPQVGFILRRSELTRQELHEVPLDSADADTQGAIGYMIQQSLANEFRRLP
jgi:hypothetical protein